jgi:predicted chitinase
MNESENILERYREKFAIYAVNTPKRKAMFMANVEYEASRPFHGKYEGKYGYLKTLFLKVLYNHRLSKVLGFLVESSKTSCDFKYNCLGMLKLENPIKFTKHYSLKPSESINSEYNAMTLSLLYWSYLSLNRCADVDDVVGCTLRLTGCLRGLKQRAELYKKWIKFFEEPNQI